MGISESCRAAISHRANLTRLVAPQAVKANSNNSRLRDNQFKLYDLTSEVFMDDTAHGVRLANGDVRPPAPVLSDDEDRSMGIEKLTMHGF